MPLTYYGMTALFYPKFPFHIINIIIRFLKIRPYTLNLLFSTYVMLIFKNGEITHKKRISGKIGRDKLRRLEIGWGLASDIPAHATPAMAASFRT